LLHEQNPAALIKAHFEQMWATDMAKITASNPCLQFELIDVVRCEGDWLAAVVAPWAISLLLLNGGGRLWGDIPAGQRRYLDLPGTTLPFVAETDADIGSWQTAALVEAIDQVADMAAARRLARDGLQMALGLAQTNDVAQAMEPKAPVTRRGFFRRLAGKRD
jgi:[NiFe] hydrogenase assembly HybE family chaperone